MAMFDSNDLMTVSAAALESGGLVTEGGLRARILNGTLPVIRVGHAVLILRTTFEDLMRQLSVK